MNTFNSKLIIPQSIVYLLDDEPQVIEILGQVVELTGLKPLGFTRANQFFEQISTFEQTSILVLDLNMPEMDGIEVMRRLSSMDSPPALILMSGHDTSVLRAAEKLGHAHNLEIIASLSKPISLDKFQEIIEHNIPKIKKYEQRETARIDNDISSVELQQAIKNNNMVLHYQPQIDIKSGELLGVEALVRWLHPQHGLISPDRFIAMAEQSGIIGKLTHWVIEQAVEQGQQWQKRGLDIPVSVNISAVDITSLTLPEHVANLLECKKLDPTRLTLEVTEGTLMGELVTSLDILTRLRLKGLGLSIDDFGTGYSSLSQLHRVPFTELKIDQSFVSNMTEDEEARAIVRTCIILGHELKLKIVAEGVETAEQFELLKQMNCDIAQGYFISRPVPGEQITNKYQ
ncbi:GGDEF/EAL domain-containing response regulator [Colwellia sp. 12G3]|uniref:GGDEF/EAL domain-containing response regulator n=1 Tax=Colwellia sp. 12G3 TaxID=2058299 RepID=UPI000C34D95E|nr:EAL domain-containing response regulator [Colwellia sp. 12G3]PKI13227.1 diguanylate phosphodiesterase [Colwellia sp. 12G3]